MRTLFDIWMNTIKETYYSYNDDYSPHEVDLLLILGIEQDFYSNILNYFSYKRKILILKL